MDGDKAMGTDGFNIALFPIMLGYIVKDDLYMSSITFMRMSCLRKAFMLFSLHLSLKRLGSWK